MPTNKRYSKDRLTAIRRHESSIRKKGSNAIYRPNRITAHAGERIRLRFVRHDYTPCTRDVVFPTLGIRRTLPTDEPVVIELPALEAGEYAFRCGMNMIHGTLVVVAR